MRAAFFLSRTVRPLFLTAQILCASLKIWPLQSIKAQPAALLNKREPLANRLGNCGLHTDLNSGERVRKTDHRESTSLCRENRNDRHRNDARLWSDFGLHLSRCRLTSSPFSFFSGRTHSRKSSVHPGVQIFSTTQTAHQTKDIPSPSFPHRFDRRQSVLRPFSTYLP